jgi:hypothetical protein
MKGIVMTLALLLVGLSDSAAQSLADVANKEKERREALGSSKVETYDDSNLATIHRTAPPSTPSAGLPAEGTESSDSGDEGEDSLTSQATEQEDPTQTEAYWRDRKASIDRRITDIQGQLNEPGFASDPDNLMRRNQLEQQLQQARSDLTALQAEARSAGVPPGWVR